MWIICFQVINLQKYTFYYHNQYKNLILVFIYCVITKNYCWHCVETFDVITLSIFINTCGAFSAASCVPLGAVRKCFPIWEHYEKSNIKTWASGANVRWEKDYSICAHAASVPSSRKAKYSKQQACAQLVLNVPSTLLDRLCVYCIKWSRENVGKAIGL